ncbi:hypothetical protein DOE76_11405 [Leifsonia sp. ku-ls]|jgi:hypothetical protein|nr:hypothetical protein DOE76_11405 [Leifsonia sp. ku-ls]
MSEIDDRGRPDEPDDAVSEYENDEADDRASLEREAGLTALGGPGFGHLFDQAPPDDRGFDAEHNR